MWRPRCSTTMCLTGLISHSGFPATLCPVSEENEGDVVGDSTFLFTQTPKFWDALNTPNQYLLSFVPTNS